MSSEGCRLLFLWTTRNLNLKLPYERLRIQNNSFCTNWVLFIYLKLGFVGRFRGLISIGLTLKTMLIILTKYYETCFAGLEQGRLKGWYVKANLFLTPPSFSRSTDFNKFGTKKDTSLSQSLIPSIFHIYFTSKVCYIPVQNKQHHV